MGRFWASSRLSKKQAYANISDRSDIMAPSSPSSLHRSGSAFLPAVDNSSRHFSSAGSCATPQEPLFHDFFLCEASLQPTFIGSPAKTSSSSVALASPTSTLSPDFLRTSDLSCITSPTSQTARRKNGRQQPRLRPSQMPLSYSIKIIDRAFFFNACLYRDVLHVPPLTATNHQIRTAYFRRGREVLVTPNLNETDDDDMTTMSLGVDGDSSIITMMSIQSSVPVSRRAKMQFQAISVAYEILHNVVLRREYDFKWRLLHPPAALMHNEKHDDRVSQGELSNKIIKCVAREPTDKNATRNDHKYVNAERTSSITSACSHLSHASVLRNGRTYPRSSSTTSSVIQRQKFVTWNEQVEESTITDYDPNEHFPVPEPMDAVHDEDSDECTTESEDDESESTDSFQNSVNQESFPEVDVGSKIDYFEQLEASVLSIPLRKSQHQMTQCRGEEKQKTRQNKGKTEIKTEASNISQKATCTANVLSAALSRIYVGQQQKLEKQHKIWSRHSDSSAVAPIDCSSIGTSDNGCRLPITDDIFFPSTFATSSSREDSQLSKKEVDDFSPLKSEKVDVSEQFIHSKNSTEKETTGGVERAEEYKHNSDSLFQSRLNEEWMRVQQQDHLKRIDFPESFHTRDIVTTVTQSVPVNEQKKKSRQRKVINPRLTLENNACFPQSADLTHDFHMHLGKFIQAVVDDMKNSLTSFGNVLDGCGNSGATKHSKLKHSKVTCSRSSQKETNAEGFVLMNSELDALMDILERDVDGFVVSKHFANQQTFRSKDNRRFVKNESSKKPIKKQAE